MGMPSISYAGPWIAADPVGLCLVDRDCAERRVSAQGSPSAMMPRKRAKKLGREAECGYAAVRCGAVRCRCRERG